MPLSGLYGPVRKRGFCECFVSIECKLFFFCPELTSPLPNQAFVYHDLVPYP